MRRTACASGGDGQWKLLFAGTAGGWGFLSYKKGADSILIFGNGVDEVQVWDGQAESSAKLEGVPAKGKFFALHYERVWMCGDVENPDRLYYSRMLNPNDWTGDAVTPETGGGFVDLPTFDGGVITNLYSVGGDLCILKSTTAMLLYGTSPDNYQVTRMSGEMGTIAGRTAAVYGQTGYFVTAHGIGVQSGTTISLLDDRKLPRLFDGDYCEEPDCGEGLSPHFGACAAGICFRERLWFALPLGQERRTAWCWNTIWRGRRTCCTISAGRWTLRGRGRCAKSCWCWVRTVWCARWAAARPRRGNGARRGWISAHRRKRWRGALCSTGALKARAMRRAWR